MARPMVHGLAIVAGLAIAASAGAALAQPATPVVGAARVIDSDVIAIGEQRFVLHGVESVERGQPCYIGNQLWDCYPAAVRELELLVSLGDVRCLPVAGPDMYGRLFAVCDVQGLSINEGYVRAGFGIARPQETADYVAAQEAAMAERVGLWQANFQPPGEFRRAQGIDDRP
ncbi:MAG: thermonuclease family protein [Bauldia sp.]